MILGSMGTMTFYLDPTGHYREKGAEPSELLEALGMLPFFAHAAHKKSPRTPKEALDLMGREYRFPFAEDIGATIDNAGIWQYPGDPPLHPVMTCKINATVRVHIYPHSLVAVVGPKKTLTTRMD